MREHEPGGNCTFRAPKPCLGSPDTDLNEGSLRMSQIHYFWEKSIGAEKAEVQRPWGEVCREFEVSNKARARGIEASGDVENFFFLLLFS